jgi:tetratricopeptide (TPR) repeat protein/transcriptional regulator with XRE-family HTH domain
VPDDTELTAPAKRERLAQRRKALGLTQEDLAGLLGIERSTVVRWERGETQPVAWIRPKLAEVLRVSPEQLGELLDAGARPDGTTGPGKPRNPPVSPVPRQLPAAVADFTGRAAELQALTRILDDAGGGGPGTVVISAIGGTAGVGKTALALHWAHQSAHRFGEGQLYVNLRGFDPSGIPVTPAEAIRGFLDVLGITPERIPPPADAQAALYRGLLADKRMLIVLDNARDEQQVRPLLPASPASLVIVTSRNQLVGLAAADGARLLTLDVLTHHDAVELLTARLGAGQAAAEPGAVAEIATLCACLPLALTVAAARTAARPWLPIADLAAELHDAVGRLDALDAGDPTASVRAVFSWSYAQLTDGAARLFRLLGLHPGPDISVHAAASVAGAGEPDTRRMLRELTRAQLLNEHVPGRYAFHDLLRAYAAGQARAHDRASERDAAIGRLLAHYLHTAHAAVLVYNPSQEPIVLAPSQPGVFPERPADYQQALAWFEAEHDVLLGAVALAAESGFDSHAWQLPWAMMPFLARRGQFREWVSTQRVALVAATRLGDLAGQAVCGRLLASAYGVLGDYGHVFSLYADSLKLYQRLGNRAGETRIHHGLYVVAERQGRYADALDHAEQALRVARAVGDKPATARMLNVVGWCHGLLGDYQRTRAFCERSLALVTEVGDRFFEPNVWDSLGYAEHHLGNFGEAATCYERALRLFREFGDPMEEALTLVRLGDSRHAAGEMVQAREAWQQALAILEDLGHSDAVQVRAKLAGTAGQDPDGGR